MKTLIRIVVFYGVTFVFTIILSTIQHASGIVDAGKIVLAQFGPGLATLTMLVLFRKDNTKITISFKGISFLKYLGVISIPVLVSMMLFLIYSRFIRPLSLPAIDVASFAIILAGMLLGAYGEELGWRGYLQNLLDRRLNTLVAFILVGILWGLWHVGNYLNGPVYMLFFILSTIGYSGVMAWLILGTNYNVILACLFHFAVNAGFYVLKNALADTRLIAMNGLAWISIAAVIAWFNRKDFLRFHNGAGD